MSTEGGISYDLTEEEATVLGQGLLQWGGPARPTRELAAALGWTSVSDLLNGSQLLRRRIQAAEGLSALEWTQALAAAEIAFASDVFGAGYEWQTCTGLDDAMTLRVMRGLQRKLVEAFGPTVGNGLGTRD